MYLGCLLYDILITKMKPLRYCHESHCRANWWNSVM